MHCFKKLDICRDCDDVHRKISRVHNLLTISLKSGSISKKKKGNY